jgi:hypothetical protein
MLGLMQDRPLLISQMIDLFSYRHCFFQLFNRYVHGAVISDAGD